MKIEFADSFWESLRRLNRQQTWWFKTYVFFRYDIPWLFRNIWRFRRQLWKHRPWDSHHTLGMMRASLSQVAERIRDGNEIEKPRMKKYAAIMRAIELLDNYTTDNYIQQAEKLLGYEVDASTGIFMDNETPEIKEKNKKIFDLSTKLEEEQWKELFEILQGREFSPAEGEDYYDVFDGSGMRGWWN